MHRGLLLCAYISVVPKRLLLLPLSRILRMEAHAPRTRVIPQESPTITYHYTAWLLELQPQAMFATRLPYASSFSPSVPPLPFFARVSRTVSPLISLVSHHRSVFSIVPRLPLSLSLVRILFTPLPPSLIMHRVRRASH